MIINHDFWKPIEGSGFDDSLTLVAIDPGGTTGWAAVRMHREDVVGGLLLSASFWEGRRDAASLFSGQVESLMSGVPSVHHGEQKAVARMQHIIQVIEEAGISAASALSDGSAACATHVVVEDFIVRQGTMDRSLLSPVRLTSMLFDRLQSSDRTYTFHLQSPSDAKSTISDSHLKSLGLYVRGQEHARDATRHMLTALRRYIR